MLSSELPCTSHRPENAQSRSEGPVWKPDETESCGARAEYDQQNRLDAAVCHYGFCPVGAASLLCRQAQRHVIRPVPCGSGTELPENLIRLGRADHESNAQIRELVDLRFSCHWKTRRTLRLCSF